MHTSDLPIITTALAQKFFPDYYVSIGSEPSVLGPDPIPALGLRVWRKERSPQIQNQINDFLEAAFEVFGIGAGQKLQNLFKEKNKFLKLNDENKLVNRGGDIFEAKVIVDLYLKDLGDNERFAKLPKLLTEEFAANANGFAEDLVDSLQRSLMAMPYGTELQYDCIDKSQYNQNDCSSWEDHEDDYDHMQIHYTDPGSPYMRSPNYINREDPFAVCRSAAGDITLHGCIFRHGLATAARSLEGINKLRMSFGFRTIYPSLN